MRVPATALHRHLMWTRSGTVWATWRLSPVSYAYAPRKRKKLVRRAHTALFQALRGDSLMFGLTADLDPASVAMRMLEGLDPENCPDWVDEVEATLDTLETIPLGTRAFWLSVPLATTGPLQAIKEQASAAMADISDVLAMPRTMPSEKTIDEALARANEIGRVIPKVFEPRPISPAEQVWMALHSQQRGLGNDTTVPLSTVGGDVTEEIIHTGSQIPNPWLDEGGQSDLPRTSLEILKPYKRKFLKIAGPTGLESYQVIQGLTGIPSAGWQFPDAEWLSYLDKLPVDADWAIRMSTTDAETAKKEAKTQENTLDEQYTQRTDGERITGTGSELDMVAEDMALLQSTLNASDREVKVEVTAMIAVGGRTAEEAQEKARFVAESYKGNDFIFDPPLGGQEDLWWQMQPGVPHSRLCRELSKVTTGSDLAAAVPLVSTGLGASKGSFVGKNISTERQTPLFLDPEGSMMGNTSGSCAVGGETGAGKTFFMKKEAGNVIGMGGRFVAVDHSSTGEWGFFAQSVTDATVVEILNPQYSLDPLRIFGLRAGSRITQSLFASVLNIEPTSDLGIAVADVLDPEYLAEWKLTSLGGVLEHLQSEQGEIDGADQIARRIRVFSRKDIGRVLFDPDLPALSLDSRGIVFLTRELELPDGDDLKTPHLFARMSVEKILGRAIYTLLSGIGREICFKDDWDLAVMFISEAHHMTSSPECERDIKAFVREGRKAKAAIYLDSQDPDEDFGSETTKGLIPVRILMRQRDETLARKSLKWLGADPEDEELLEMVMKDLSPVDENEKVIPGREGEGFMRDARNRYGKIQVLPPALKARDIAVRTTPKESVDAA